MTEHWFIKELRDAWNNFTCWVRGHENGRVSYREHHPVKRWCRRCHAVEILINDGNPHYRQGWYVNSYKTEREFLGLDLK